MKKYTQEEFDALPRDEYGIKRCPSGDYSAIKSFGKCCSFGEWCRFGKGCKCEFGEFTKMLTAGGFGSVGRTTYFFLLNSGEICVRCGCFADTLEAWETKVRETHGDNAYGRAYLLLIPAVKAAFGA